MSSSSSSGQFPSPSRPLSPLDLPRRSSPPPRPALARPSHPAPAPTPAPRPAAAPHSFAKLQESLRACGRLLQFLMQHKDAGPFLEPVNWKEWGLTDYVSIGVRVTSESTFLVPSGRPVRPSDRAGDDRPALRPPSWPRSHASPPRSPFPPPRPARPRSPRSSRRRWTSSS